MAIGNPIKRIRRKSKTNRSRLRRPINVVASVLTTFGLYCGIASIFASINVEFEKAAYWIIGAMVFDILDGTVARLTKSTSDFGKELDSLCDLVSFGVSPAVLIYAAYMQEEQLTGELVRNTGAMMAIIFVICGALRLARYNVFQSTRRDYFTGLPIPAAAGTIASFELFTHYLEINVVFWVLGPLTLGLAFLMVSTVLYPKDRFKAYLLAPGHAFRFLALGAIGIAIFHYAIQYHPSIVLLPIGASYVGWGIGYDIYLRARRLAKKPIETQQAAGKAATVKQ